MEYNECLKMAKWWFRKNGIDLVMFEDPIACAEEEGDFSYCPVGTLVLLTNNREPKSEVFINADTIDVLKPLKPPIEPKTIDRYRIAEDIADKIIAGFSSKEITDNYHGELCNNYSHYLEEDLISLAKQHNVLITHSNQ